MGSTCISQGQSGCFNTTLKCCGMLRVYSLRYVLKFEVEYKIHTKQKVICCAWVVDQYIVSEMWLFNLKRNEAMRLGYCVVLRPFFLRVLNLELNLLVRFLFKAIKNTYTTEVGLS